MVDKQITCKCCGRPARWCGEGESACGIEDCDHIHCDTCGMHYSLESKEVFHAETLAVAKQMMLAAYNPEDLIMAEPFAPPVIPLTIENFVQLTSVMDDFGISLHSADSTFYFTCCASCGRDFILDMSIEEIMAIDSTTPLRCGGSERCIP